MALKRVNESLCGVVAAVLLSGLCTASEADPILLNPTDDARVTPSDVVTTDYLIAGDGDVFGRGILEFSTAAFLGQVASATLSVNPYGLPLWAPTIRVYGYESTNGLVDLSDYSAGVVLGDWTLPSGLDFRQDALFDVTAFLRTVGTPFAGFVLQGLYNPAISGTGYDVFSSIEYNYGHPAQLSVTVAPVPEPGTFSLFSAALLALLVGGGLRNLKCRALHA